MIHGLIPDLPYTPATHEGAHPINSCASCGSITGPFASCTTHGISDPLYLCATCGGQVADVFGWTAPHIRAELDETIEGFQSRLRALDAELEQAKENMVVPLADVIDLVAAKQKRVPAKAGA